MGMIFRWIMYVCVVGSVLFWLTADNEGEMLIGACITVVTVSVAINISPSLTNKIMKWLGL